MPDGHAPDCMNRSMSSASMREIRSSGMTLPLPPAAFPFNFAHFLDVHYAGMSKEIAPILVINPQRSPCRLDHVGAQNAIRVRCRFSIAPNSHFVNALHRFSFGALNNIRRSVTSASPLGRGQWIRSYQPRFLRCRVACGDLALILAPLRYHFGLLLILAPLRYHFGLLLILALILALLRQYRQRFLAGQSTLGHFLPFIHSIAFANRVACSSDTFLMSAFSRNALSSTLCDSSRSRIADSCASLMVAPAAGAAGEEGAAAWGARAGAVTGMSSGIALIAAIAESRVTCLSSSASSKRYCDGVRSAKCSTPANSRWQ